MLKRNLSLIKTSQLIISYGDKINIETISKLSKSKIRKIMKEETNETIESFIHNTISQWVNNNDSEDILNTLLRIVKKTGITLNPLEEEKLFIMEEREFASSRNIKVIEVNNELADKEYVAGKFRNCKLFKEVNNRLVLIFKGELLISNFNLIINSENKEHKYSYVNMEWFKGTERGFEFGLTKNNKFILRIHDQKTLNNFIGNFIKKKNKKIFELKNKIYF